MKELIDQKMEILKEHLPKAQERLVKANHDLMELVTKALKDRKIEAKIGLGILNKIKASGKVGTDSSINMDGEQRLEMFKISYENAKETVTILNDQVKMVYESSLKSIDEQLEFCRDELEKIDEELKKAKGEEKKRLQMEKDRMWTRSA